MEESGDKNNEKPLRREDSNSNDSLQDVIFEDACSNLDADNVEGGIDLQIAFNHSEAAIDKFFNNDITGAFELMTPWAGTSLYHSLGVAIFEFIPAILTFEPIPIQRALASIKKCVAICNKTKKQQSFMASIGSIVKKPNYAVYTDLEAHAELCHAEALLLQAALTIIDGEDLTELLKATFKIKTSYNTYVYCWEMKDHKRWESQNSKDNFISGVRLGIATFNLMISILPQKFVSILEFVGFSSNKDYGISELVKGAEAPGMRRVLCDLVLLAYNLVLCPFAGADGDYQACRRIIQKSLQVYPNSKWFLVFKARLQLLQGDIKDAIAAYTELSSTEGVVRQFDNLCYWELMWINALMLDCPQAIYNADMLLQKSSWSKTTYTYMKIAMNIQSGHDSDAVDVEQLITLIRNAKMFVMRLVGKSLPMEKFTVRRCARYQAQGFLVLPGYELLCLWGLLPLLRNNHQDVLQTMLKTIETTRVTLTRAPSVAQGAFEADNMALLDYLQGSVLAAMGMPCLAIEKYNDVLKCKKSIKQDTFLIPYTVCDMAMCYYELEDYDRTLELLSEARKKYSGYYLESRLHFRVHARTQMVKQVIANKQK